jgi:hypothetical protein
MTDDMITVRRDDLHAVMARAGARDWTPESDPKFAAVWERLTEAEAVTAPAVESEPPLPRGEFGRVELPGFVHYTGWVTDGTRAGCPVVVISDWDGRKVAEVVPQAMRQFIALPTPLKRPEPQAALPAGEGFGDEYAEMPDDSRPF